MHVPSFKVFSVGPANMPMRYLVRPVRYNFAFPNFKMNSLYDEGSGRLDSITAFRIFASTSPSTMWNRRVLIDAISRSSHSNISLHWFALAWRAGVPCTPTLVVGQPIQGQEYCADQGAAAGCAVSRSWVTAFFQRRSMFAGPVVSLCILGPVASLPLFPCRFCFLLVVLVFVPHCLFWAGVLRPPWPAGTRYAPTPEGRHVINMVALHGHVIHSAARRAFARPR